MTKKKLKITALKIFTIFLPLSAVIGSIILVLGFLIFPSSFSQPEVLEANITDGKFKFDEKIAFFNNQFFLLLFPSQKY
jgi:hypothetical protein